jgi:cytochrome b561
MQARYSALNQALHWTTALCMFAILPLGWVMSNGATVTPYDEVLLNWHKTLGLIVLVITLFRIVWRFVDGPPPYPPMIAAWERVLAHAIYWLFLLVLIWMPVTGYLDSTFAGHLPKLFNLIPTPALAHKDRPLRNFFRLLHVSGQWAVYALLLLHLGAVVLHLIWRRTGLLGRMLPANATEPASTAPH